MKTRTAVTAAAVIAIGFTVGYMASQHAKEPSEDAQASAAPSAKTIMFSSRPGASVGPGALGAPAKGDVPTDGKEKVEGARLHQSANETCRDDQQCLYSTCSRACGEWIGKTYEPGDFATLRIEQQVFINCVGYCLDPRELASGSAASN